MEYSSMATDGSTPPDARSRLFSPSLHVSHLAALCAQQAVPSLYPLASTITHNIPIYVLPTHPPDASALQDEWYRILHTGPGVFVIKSLIPAPLIDRVTSLFHAILRARPPTGDHFAAGAANERIWDALSKHCIADAASFVQYYSAPLLTLAATAWLGPGHRVTAQVNNVRPGAAAQTCHRDYHLGFASAEACAQVPAAAQLASQFLTLQAGIAHGAVPRESGPTRVLPFSQSYAPGYVAYRRAEFAEFFEENYVALPMEAGDAIFFNPALFHAAGSNEGGHDRLVNLLQIGSAWTKTMEAGDAVPLVEACWQHMKLLYAEKGLGDDIRGLVAAVAEGYPFPTNLDKNPPRASGMAPMSEQDAIIHSLQNDESKDQVLKRLRGIREASKALGEKGSHVYSATYQQTMMEADRAIRWKQLGPGQRHINSVLASTKPDEM